MPLQATPIRSLQVGQWVVLEEAGLVQITTLTWFPESVDIDYDGTDSPLTHHLGRLVYGTWSGLFEDFPHIDVWITEENSHG